ncbi:unnamed protein product [Paramecium sonneborni]|uniref:Uncharacterized protein n=1 Tax=Paramecium sonneborni TaxID=65129 RepID=A0A8S1MI44_9CILI|nr:unnamed protein product [Paramecium sonneborni]
MSNQKRDYKKVEKCKREALISLVFSQGLKIKEASQNLDIKYAVAKTIIVAFRKKYILEKKEIMSTKKCRFQPRINQISVHRIISKIGGKCVNLDQEKIL